jgi:ribosomal-protein-alanine N-acetyltransferase
VSAIEIRRARMEDLVAILQLAQRVREAPQWSEGVYRAMLEDRSVVSRVLLVAGAESLCGFAVGSVVLDQAELESVVVQPESRRAGVGRELGAAVLQWAREAGAREIRLEVRAGNQAARRLYLQLGFVEAGVRAGYYAAPQEDAVLMCLRLTSADL